MIRLNLLNKKQCTKCKHNKFSTQFSKRKIAKDNLQSCCKQCKQLEYHQWKIKYNIDESARVAAYRKKYPEKAKAISINWYKNNREEVNLKHKDWCKTNRIHIRKYKQHRYNTDIQYKLSELLRSRLIKAIKSSAKSGSAVSDLGCSIEDFKKHIESKFQPGMSWSNWRHDGWHIDHIIPLSSFNLTRRDDFLKACHYTNMQPLWWYDNLSKSTKIQDDKSLDLIVPPFEDF